METQQHTFKNIVNFVKDIYFEYGSSDKPLTLYNHLLDKTTLTHTKAIQKHVEAFSNFFNKNLSAMKERNLNLFTHNTINYSENVFINIVHFMKISSQQNINVLWNHLYVIWNSIEPTAEKELFLKELNNKHETPEDNFINSILGKVEKAVGNVNVSSNPMAAVMGLISSGVLTDVMTTMKDGMSNGNLDINKMIGTVSKMVKNVSGGNGLPVEVMNMMNNFNFSSTTSNENIVQITEQKSPQITEQSSSSQITEQKSPQITKQSSSSQITKQKSPQITEQSSSSQITKQKSPPSSQSSTPPSPPPSPPPSSPTNQNNQKNKKNKKK